MPDEAPGPAPLLNWTALYLIVAGALVLEIAAFALLHWIYR
jgi:hypothetical protein